MTTRCIYSNSYKFLLSPGASGTGLNRTLALRMVSHAFYHCATTAGSATEYITAVYYCTSHEQILRYLPGNSNLRERLSTADLLIKIGGFVKKG